MKFFILLLVAFCFNAAAVAEDIRFYLGTYTDNPLSQGIYTGTLDTRTGKISPLELAAKATSPNYLALAPSGKFLYASTLAGDGSVAAFRVDPAGHLAKLNEVSSGGGARHLSVDATGRNLLVANYVGGSAACFQLQPDGSIGQRTAFIQLTGSGPNPQRQTQPHIHSIYLDAANRFAYACDLGTDHVWLFGFDAQAGRLTLMSQASGTMPPGSGTRHLAISPDGNFLYANGEMGLDVTTFARDPATGALTALPTVPAMPPGISTNDFTSAEIFCHPSGKWLYVSNRDITNRGRDTIAVYSIAGGGGLSRIQDMPAQVEVPRGFGIDPTGQWLIVGGQQDNKIAVLKIDSATGKLSTTDQTAAVGAPICVIFAGGNTKTPGNPM
jgi:6-phosphogluconolactonase